MENQILTLLKALGFEKPVKKLTITFEEFDRVRIDAIVYLDDDGLGSLIDITKHFKVIEPKEEKNGN